MSAPTKIGRNEVACIVLNWNGGRDSEKCIRSLLESEGVDVDIVVVDNGSTDGSADMLAGHFPSIAVLRQPGNAGVAAGFNRGIEWGVERCHSLFFFLNNDATVEKDCLRLLKQVLDQHSRTGIVSPRILDANGEGIMWFDGGRMNAAGDPVHRGMFFPVNAERDIRPQDFASGCAMLVRGQVFTDAGMFDERFFAYSEDVDFSLRARQCGWDILHCPRAIATHVPSSSARTNRGKWFRDYYVTRNKLLLMQGRLKGWRRVLFHVYFWLRYVGAHSTLYLLRGEFRRVRAVGNAVSDFMHGRFGGRYS